MNQDKPTNSSVGFLFEPTTNTAKPCKKETGDNGQPLTTIPYLIDPTHANP